MTATSLNLIISRQRLFWRVSIVTGALILAYIYLAQSVVFNVVSRQNVLEKSAKLQTQVVALETEYLALSNQVTVDLAHQLGFHDAASETIFAPVVTLPSQTVALSYKRRP